MVANRNEADTGFVGEALESRSARLEFLLREDQWTVPALDRYDMVVSLGSEWSVYAEQVAPEVGREVALLRQAVAAGKPVLGVCFGGQILAAALGGSVRRADAPELGWHLVESDAADLLPAGPYVQWHSDQFEVPPGARELARNAAGPQAFVRGAAVGLQFHPEATAEVVRRWCVSGLAELAMAGVDPVDFVTESDQRQDEARKRADVIVESFLSGALFALAPSIT